MWHTNSMYNPVEKIVLPEGFKTRKEIKKLFGLGKTAINKRIKRFGIKPEYTVWVSPRKCTYHIYRPEDIKDWLAEIEQIKLSRRPTCVATTAVAQAKLNNAEKILRAMDAIALEDISDITGFEIQGVFLEHLRIQILDKFYYAKKDILKLVEERRVKSEISQKIINDKRTAKRTTSGKFYHREDSFSLWQRRELKNKNMADLYLEKGYNTGKPYKKQGVEKNCQYWKKHVGDNLVHFECNDCQNILPYYSFYFDPTYSKGRRHNCIDCHRAKAGPKRKKEKGPSYFLAHCFIGSIKRDLANKSGEYCTKSSVEIWHLIETHLGYNKDDLVKHIESKFIKKMSWSNHGRPAKSNQFRWQVDHIKPRSSFSYTSIEDDDFKECWSLVNLMPIEAKMNSYKSNKKLMRKVQSDLRRAIKENKRSSLFDHLPYDVDQLRNHFKSFDVKLDECGKTWAIDHIVPQAAKPFQSFKNKNFQTLLALDNLQPLTKSENSSKGSKYQDKRWFHNYDK